MLRVIREVAPSYVVAENVSGILTIENGLVFEQVCLDLENEGYEVQAFIIPACAVDAPHRRDRVWFVGNRNGTGFQTERAEQQAARIEQYGKLDRSFANTNNARNTTPNSGIEPYGSEIGKEREQPRVKPNGYNVEHVSNTTIKGLERATGQSQRRNYGLAGYSEPTGWRNFPTQPPICGGNDGIPRKLDGITFSKWRNESIKAYGNAIVPQVAYEIFKAIIMS